MTMQQEQVNMTCYKVLTRRECVEFMWQLTRNYKFRKTGGQNYVHLSFEK